MPVALDTLPVGEETPWDDKMQIVLGAGTFPRASGIGRSASLALGTPSGSAFGLRNANSGAWAICVASCLLSNPGEL